MYHVKATQYTENYNTDRNHDLKLETDVTLDDLPPKVYYSMKFMQ